MIFNSLPFIVFFLLFFSIYFAVKGRIRLLWCLTASYFFYGWWDWRFLSLIMLSTLVDFWVGKNLANTQARRERKKWMWLSVGMNLGILGFFKYFNFFADSFILLVQGFGLEADPVLVKVLLPVGISFYTFQSMSYSIDLYRKQIEVEPDLLRFATYISFFPQLVAGPIVRAKDFLPQLRTDKSLDPDRVAGGLGQVLWGFFKKVVVADSLAPFVDLCFASPEGYSSIHLTLGVVFYAFQIYCDFSGYSDIAIGLARMLGFNFPNNFRTPYFSKSFSEFWQRWHITLSSWLRDYLYIPLGGNRHGKWNTFKNLMITMLLGGLWHGANWTFVFWGFLHGFFLIIQRLLKPVLIPPQSGFVRTIYDAAAMGLVFFFTCIAWVYFRSPDFSTANQILFQIGALDGIHPGSIVNKFQALKGAIVIALLLVVEVSDFRFEYANWALRNPYFRVIIYALILLTIAFWGTFGSNAFIYFQF